MLMCLIHCIIRNLIIPKFSVAERAVRTTNLICVKVAKAKLRHVKYIHCGEHRVAAPQQRKYSKRANELQSFLISIRKYVCLIFLWRYKGLH